MSVASKTKTKIFTTVGLGFVAVLSVLPTWASTTPGTISSTTVQSISDSNQSQQDLSVLRTKLKERFSGVATEVRSIVHGTTSVLDSSEGPAVRTIDVSQGIGVRPAISRQDFFVDIENDPYKTFITRLSAYGVLNSSQKFYPQNYFRVDDFLSVFTKLYHKKTGQPLNSQDISGIVSEDGIMTKGILQKLMYSFKNLDMIDINGNPYDKLVRSEGAYYLVRIFDVPVLPSDETTSFVIGDTFTDITDHPFASAITTLSNLHILTTQSAKFYPDNYLRHYDFVIIFVNAFLASKNQSLPILAGYSQFADVGSSASYLPQLAYAADHGFIDYIVTSKMGQLYFGPDEFMTKHEVYQILAKTLNIQFVYDPIQADQQKISRAELAKLLVDSFQFDTKISSESAISSGNSLNMGDLSVLTKLRTLLSML